MAVKAEENEEVSSWIEYPSKSAATLLIKESYRDTDERVGESMPFDGKRINLS
ncbi:hypothetical protein ACNKHM_04795 [Shigella sonnei]